MAIKTNTKYNFDEAENDVFSWKHFDGTGGNLLWHKESQRYIYQMSWLEDGKMSEPVTGEVRDQASAFWNELSALEEGYSEDDDCDYQEPEHGENGYCRKCHSYCFGDCEAN